MKGTLRIIKNLFLYIILLFLFSNSFTSGNAKAVAPTPREQLSLNGTWNFTPSGRSTSEITVPSAWDYYQSYDDVSQASYEKTVIVPNQWAGKRVKLEFEGVNHIASVYVNGNLIIDEHLGGWIPFSADITPYLTFGFPVTITVDVKGGSHQPIVDANGFPAWPVGWLGHRRQWGILFDTFLRAYGDTHIEDAFIQTSVSDQNLRIDYTLVNTTSQDQIIEIAADILLNDNIIQNITPKTVSIPAQSTIAHTLDYSWSDPVYWTPSNPTLYLLVSQIKKDDTVIDEVTTRFGFREITVSGNQFYLNGNRLNLWGDSMNVHAQGFKTGYVNKNDWPSIVDRLLERNIRVLRPHQQPAAPYILDVADEKGLLIIEESPMYARQYLTSSNKPTYLSNSLDWIKDWVIARRNHPSIIIWSVENELGNGAGYIRWFTNSELLQLGDKVREFDTTRPVGYDGDRDVGDALYNMHYPEGYDQSWSGSIYKLNPQSKPTGVGEFLTDYGPSLNKWWQGTATRGLRYKNFTDIRPYNLYWAWDKSLSDPQVNNLVNSFAPIALFDYNYDDSNLSPLANDIYESYSEGQWVTRDLVLYNDDFSNTTVTANVELFVDSTLYAYGSVTGTLPLGTHVKFPYTFQVPNQGGQVLTVRLSTYKNSILQFSELIYFNINETGQSGTTSDQVVLNWQTSPTPTFSPTPISSPTPTPLSGDTDSDGDVDIFDYNNLLTQFGQSGAGLTGDFDGDSDVDIFDYNTLLTNFGL